MFNHIIVYIYRYGNPLLCILGNIGNLLSVIIFLKKSWRNNVCVFYFLICLFLSSIYLHFTILEFTLFVGFNVKLQASNVILCKLFYFIPSFVSVLLPTILIAASIDRLFVSPRDVNTDKYNSKRFAYFSVSISTAFWFIFNFPFLVDTNLREVNWSVTVCSYDSATFHFNFVYYCLMTIEILFCLIILILCVVSVKKLCRIWRSRRQSRKQIRPMKIKDFQILCCLFIHDIIYIISSIFSAVFSVYNIATKLQRRTAMRQAMHDFLSDLFILFSFIFYCSSFSIFIFVSKAFRKELKGLVYMATDVIRIRRRQTHQGDALQNNMESNNIVSNIDIE
jgi:hypothetical protein